jgi:hypothetical protein
MIAEVHSMLAPGVLSENCEPDLAAVADAVAIDVTGECEAPVRLFIEREEDSRY